MRDRRPAALVAAVACRERPLQPEICKVAKQTHFEFGNQFNGAATSLMPPWPPFDLAVAAPARMSYILTEKNDKSGTGMDAKRTVGRTASKRHPPRKPKRSGRKKLTAGVSLADMRAMPSGTLGRFLATAMDRRVDEVADRLGLSRNQLAETVGVKPETFQRVKRATAPRTQARIREMLEIVNRVADWAGSEAQAMAWYRAEPLPAFGGRTAEALVKEGRATAVRDYLDHVALGGFA